MSFVIQTALGASFAFIAPWLIHLGAIRGADFYAVASAKYGSFGRFASKWSRMMIFLNGAFLSAGYIIWRSGIDYFYIPIIVAVPTLILQVAIIVATVYEDTRRG